MPRTTKPLTDTEVKAAKPREKVYSLADGKGLYLKIKPSGYKVWVFNYFQPLTRKRQATTLGEYPAISLADARDIRLKYQKLLARDKDPIEHKAEEKRRKLEAYENTLAVVAKNWFETKRNKVTKAYGEDIFRALELHIFPDLGDTPLNLIKAHTVIEVIKPVAARGALETVKRLCQKMNEIMVYAVNTGMIETNPLTGISKAFEAPGKRHMPTLKPEQLSEFMQTLANASIKRTTRCLIEWQLHTMTRPGEAAGTRWGEIDFDRRLWTIPAERMKKKRPHTIPLTPQMIALLEVMKPISSKREHVFSSDRNPRTHIHQQTANMALKRMGYGGELVAHGLRALASTILNEEGFDSDLIEAALAHVGKNDVRNAYNRAEYIERRRVMMDWWSNRLEDAARGTSSLKGLRAIRIAN